MTNGKIPTWFAVKWIGEHKEHRAQAPDELDEFWYSHNRDAFYGLRDWIADRNDWLLVDENGHRIPDGELSRCA